MQQFQGMPGKKTSGKEPYDPTMIVVTYSCEHNHPWPASRNHHHHHKSASNNKAIVPAEPVTADRVEQEPESKERFAELGDGSLMSTADDELGWFGEMERTATTSSAILESTILTGDETDVASMFLPMREEDESLFADLGELPDCSVVFRRVGMEREEERRRRDRGSSARYPSKSESHGADASFNLDSIYPGSGDFGSKSMNPPVYDKPVYDDDIFDGVPGLKISSKANYDDVFASVSSAPEVSSSAFDDLLGGFGKSGHDEKRSENMVRCLLAQLVRNFQ